MVSLGYFLSFSIFIFYFSSSMPFKPDDRFLKSQWSSYVYYLSEWQSKVQDKLANMTSTTIQSGISSPPGIANALKGGVFLNNTQIEEQQNVQKQIEQTLTVRILVDILRTQVR
jgi:hypothetical protein